jgi:peptide/nickel transport system permease protein
MFRDALRLPSAKIAVGILIVIAFLAIFGPLVAPFDPYAQNSKDLLQGPTLDHWLGTDDLGRDVFSRLLAGSTVSVLAALQSVVVGLVLGALPGLLSVYLGRTFEWITLRIMDSFITLPFLVFAIAMTALLGNGLTQAMFAVGILIAPAFYRVTRAAALTVSHSQYVEAAQLFGASTAWVVRKHVWRKVFPAIAVTTASMTGASLVIVSSLTFLGIGIVPPEPTWGGLLATDLGNLYQRPFGPVVPALVIIGTVWALNALADAMKDAAGDALKTVSKKTRRERGGRAGRGDRSEVPLRTEHTERQEVPYVA